VLTSVALAPTLALADPPPAPDPAAKRVDWYETPMSDPSRFSAAGHFETQLIGLGFGARGDLLYRPFRPNRGANLRLGLGLASGPEFAYLPFALGWRQHFVAHRIVTLELGAGYEQQSVFIPGLAPISRAAVYGEGGLGFRVVERGWLGVQTQLSWAPVERPGPGLSLRLGFRWDFG